MVNKNNIASISHKQKPVVSVIMPCFNSSSFISKSILSMLSQTYKSWELIVCDDCSTDGTFTTVQYFSKLDSRIYIIKNDSNLGTSASRNNALRLSTGRFILFLDSDDELLPTFLEKQISFFTKTNAAIITSGYYRKASKTNTVFMPPLEIDYKMCCRGNPLSCLTTMYDTAKIGHPFFDTSFKKSEDWVFWLNILKKGFVCKCNQEVLAVYNIHDGSKNHKKLSLIRPNYAVFRKSQNMSVIVSCFYVVRWAFYGLRKYKHVK